MCMPQKNKIADSLLKHNYFPVQKKNREELPPLFSSVSLDEKIARKLTQQKPRIGGYDQVEYLSTRFNNVPRSLAIPHPLAYSYLSLEIQEHWNKIEGIAKNSSSIIKPQKHRDGRIIIMDYDQSQRSAHRHLNQSQGQKYIVHSDISNFFHSIYTHAIPWSLAGFDEAKKFKNDRNKWYNRLDKYQRLCKRDETMGIPIGPATSNIFSECILSKIDYELAAAGYIFSRYIDDYTAYCFSHEESEKFIADLANLLKKYKLSLNLKKTFINELPSSTSVDWVADLNTRLPQTNKINYFDAIRFLDYAVNIQRMTPDGSILKYAVKTIGKRIELKAKLSVAKYAINLAFQYPILLPLLDNLLLGLNNIATFNLKGKLISILSENLISKRSDGISWCLFLLKKYCATTVSDDVAEGIIKTEDCLSIVTLYAVGGHEDKIIDFSCVVAKRDLFAMDEQWLLLYQLFHDKKIKNPYKNELLFTDVKTSKESTKDAMQREINCFNILRHEKVSFIKRKTLLHTKLDKILDASFAIYFSRIRSNIAV